MTHLLARTLSLSLLLLTAAILAPSAIAQKVASKPVVCADEGFQFKALKGFDAVPINGDGVEVLKFGDGDGDIVAYAFHDRDSKKGDQGRSVAKKKRRGIVDYLEGRYRGFTKKRAKSPDIDETVEIDGLESQHRQYLIELADFNYTIEIWSFALTHADIHLLYVVKDKMDRKWRTAIDKSAKSFKQIEREEKAEIDTSSRSFEDQLAWAENEASKVEGWHAIGTKSKRFVVLTNATKKTFIDEVLKRLEVSRDLYERDFPPPEGFNAVSVVRICKNGDEFRRFSGMQRGVAGYFSPSTVELVLYDDVQTDRNMTYAVVSHEAFHQYCHFLFDQSEAHRWFDEGHGDYYGGMKITGKRGKITPKMPAGLDRLSVIRQMVRDEKYKPLADHLYFNHGEWQNQGPTGVSGYAQSWSIIYMLRQGALRKVNRKVWKDEYADIIPNYVRVLNQGFQDAYTEIREKRVAAAEKKGKELDPDDLKINRFDLDPRDKQKIWDAAMAASWEQIDLDEFEENWVLYVEKYVK